MLSEQASAIWPLIDAIISDQWAAFCIGCCPNICDGAAIAAPAVWVSPPMLKRVATLPCEMLKTEKLAIIWKKKLPRKNILAYSLELDKLFYFFIFL